MFTIPARTVCVYRSQESLAQEERNNYVASGYACTPVVRSVMGSWSFSISVPVNDNSI